MEQPNESQKRKLDLNVETEAPKAEEATGEPSAKKAKVEESTPAKIKKQIEYYFSDSNYRRDKWLQEEAAKHPEGFIEIAKIAAFPRLQSMTTDLSVVTDIMRSSDRLTVSDDGLLVKRAHPLPAEDNSYKKTIFVRGLPEDVTIDSLEAHFSPSGAVARVIIFRDENKKPKGDACVEFETEEAAKAAQATEKQDFNGREITVSAKRSQKTGAFKEKKHQQPKTEEELKREAEEAAEAAEAAKKAQEERVERMKGTVIHVTLASEDGQEFSSDFNKWDVKAVFEDIVTRDNIKFVEFNAKQVWVRTLTADAAQQALAELNANPKEVKGVKLTNPRILEGDEEKEYIEKVLEEGNRKFGRGGNNRGRGGRGRGGRGRGGRGGRGRN